MEVMIFRYTHTLHHNIYIIKIIIAGVPRPDLRGREEPQEWEELTRKEIPGPAERCAERCPAVCFRSK